MRSQNTPQKGFGAVGLLLVLVFVLVVGFVGYKVVDMNGTKDSTTVSETDKAAPETINSQADLDKTEKALDSADAELNSTLDDKSLDADVDSLL